MIEELLRPSEWDPLMYIRNVEQLQKKGRFTNLKSLSSDALSSDFQPELPQVGEQQKHEPAVDKADNIKDV